MTVASVSVPDTALVILAAGMGSRFGGPKQLTPVGPNGEVIFDYAAGDALRAGFATVVVVTRSELEERVAAHCRGWPITPTVVCQDRDRQSSRRTKPLGTVHAALVGMAAVAGQPVAVVNADDLYDPAAYGLVVHHLSDVAAVEWALVTFPVTATVIGDRPVTRALCEVDAAGHLRGIEEGTVTARSWIGRSGRRVALRGHEPVSMNFWGFPGSAATVLGAILDDALNELPVDAELALPDAIADQVAAGAAIRALPGTGSCIGVTHPEDLDAVRAAVTRPAWGH